MNKPSKRSQRAYYSQYRGDWNGVNPIARVRPSRKLYHRQALKRGA